MFFQSFAIQFNFGVLCPRTPLPPHRAFKPYLSNQTNRSALRLPNVGWLVKPCFKVAPAAYWRERDAADQMA
jgi:hypothetical protein